jgi:hypothetical protein
MPIRSLTLGNCYSVSYANGQVIKFKLLNMFPTGMEVEIGGQRHKDFQLGVYTDLQEVVC